VSSAEVGASKSAEVGRVSSAEVGRRPGSDRDEWRLVVALRSHTHTSRSHTQRSRHRGAACSIAGVPHVNQSQPSHALHVMARSSVMPALAHTPLSCRASLISYPTSLVSLISSLVSLMPLLSTLSPHTRLMACACMHLISHTLLTNRT